MCSDIGIIVRIWTIIMFEYDIKKIKGWLFQLTRHIKSVVNTKHQILGRTKTVILPMVLE